MKKDRDHRKSRKAKANDSYSPFIKLILNSLRAAGVAFLAALAFMLVGGAVAISLRDPAGAINAIALFALFSSFFLCGFVTSRYERGSPILSGLFSAAVYLVPLLAVSLFFKSSPDAAPAGHRITLALMTFPCAVMGAFLGNVRVAKRRSVSQMRHNRRR